MKICAIDIETTGAVRQWRSGALWADDGSYYTESQADFLAALRSYAKQRYTFFAHNAEFDGTACFWDAGEDFRIHYVNDVYDCGYWRYGTADKNAQLRDSVKLAAGMSVAQLGEDIGIPKYPTPSALLGEDDWRPSWMCETHDRRECLECYNIRDAEIVWSLVNALREWCEEHSITLRKSLPGMAMELWHKWDGDVHQSIPTLKIRELSRKAHHGGRCELYKYGVMRLIYTHDIRSHYGWLLATLNLPDCSVMKYAVDAIDFDNIADAMGVIDATVDVEQQHAPPLPALHDGKVYYPVGRFRGQWSIPELANALDYGASVVKVHEAAWTNKTVKPFQITASALLDLRERALQHGDNRQLIYKLLINSIVGRLAMRETQVRRIYRRWKPGMTAEQLRGYELESSANAVYACREIGQQIHDRNGNVLWATTITAAGRVKLYDYMRQAGANLVYCDTDSVHSTSALQTGPNMPGQLISKGEWDRAVYVGPKLYHLSSDDGRDEIRAKGIPIDAAERYIHDGKTTFQRSLTVREAIEHGLPAGTWIDTSRQLGYGIGARTVHDYAAVRDRDGYSPTSPVVFLPCDVGGFGPNARAITSE